MQFEAKPYQNQRNGFAEVTGNFHYKLADYKSPRHGTLFKQKLFFQTHFNPPL